MNISFEQGVQIDKFVRRFRAKDRVLGTVYIAISEEHSEYGSLDDVLKNELSEEYIDKLVNKKLSELGAAEIYDIIDEETMLDLLRFAE